MDFFELTALELGAAIRAGEISIPEVTRAALDRAKENRHNAYITVTEEAAMERARKLQQGLAEGQSPLYGVPMVLKDNLCTRGVATTCASRMLKDFVPPYDAAAAEYLAAAGTVCLGKSNMDEFAMGSTSETSFFGPVRNPHDPHRVSGGSSGGCAAAVAEGSAFFGLGSDTGGSIRQPAAWCGLTGIKPTYGTVSRYGLVAYASSLDQVGPLCRDAADCAAVLDTIRVRDSRDSTMRPEACERLLDKLTGDVRGLRVGVPAECFGDGLDAAARAQVLAVAQGLRERGAVVEECSLPVLDHAVSAYYVIACAEASSNLARYDGVKFGWRAPDCRDLADVYSRTRSQGFGSEVKRRILLGTFVLSAGYYDAYYKKALRVRDRIRTGFRQAFERYDLLLTPTAPTAAPALGDSLSDPLKMYLGDIYTVPVNLGGLPALSMPCGTDANGLPVGAQLIGPELGEGTLLRAAHAWQQDTDYHKRGWLK